MEEQIKELIEKYTKLIKGINSDSIHLDSSSEEYNRLSVKD